MNKHLLRKLKSALLASFFFTIVLGLYLSYESGTTEGSLGLIIFYIFALVGNFLYGIPVSFLIDVLTNKIKRFHFLLSGIFYIFFAFMSYFIIKEFYFFAIICAALFFLAEEWQKVKKQNFNWKRMIVNSTLMIGITVLALYSSLYIKELIEKKTNEYYLIPAGYEGKVTVVYDIKDEQQPDKVGDYNIIKINDQGYGLTALPEPEGTFNNKYFYIDDEGRKEKIKEKCIHIGSSGSISNDNREFFFHSFTVINSECTDHFSTYGSQYLEDHSIGVEEILQREGFGDFGY